MTLEQRIEALEKEVAALKEQVSEQPRKATVSFEPKIESHVIVNQITEAILAELSKREPFNFISE